MSAAVSIRRARPEDVSFLVELFTHEEVTPFLAATRPRSPEDVLALVERSEAEPDAYGLIMIEAEGVPAGTVEFELVNRRSRIANIGGLAVHPNFRGGAIAGEGTRLFQRYLFELGFHRLQLEIYGFNERAMRHTERAGFVREGVRRKAYWRNEQWVDGILYGLVAEDLEDGTGFSSTVRP